MTEMPRRAAQAYWDKMVTGTTRFFLSINHEQSRVTVAKLAGPSYSRYLVSRTPYLLRNGYVEELFDFARPPLAPLAPGMLNPNESKAPRSLASHVSFTSS